MADLDARIRAELDARYYSEGEWANAAWKYADALRAVLAHCDEAADAGCWAVSVDLARTAIARALGIEVDNG